VCADDVDMGRLTAEAKDNAVWIAQNTKPCPNCKLVHVQAYDYFFLLLFIYSFFLSFCVYVEAETVVVCMRSV